MSKLKWKEVTKNISELQPYEFNPRNITDKGLEDLTKSIDKFGLAEPIVINTDNVIIGGHARYFVLKNLGTKECKCYIPSRKLSEDEVKELNVRLNKNIAGEWDFEILTDHFDKVSLVDWGFEDYEFDIRDTINMVNSEADEWVGMPEFEKIDAPIKIIVQFENEEDRKEFCKKINLKPLRSLQKTWSFWYPEKQKFFSSNDLKYE